VRLQAFGSRRRSRGQGLVEFTLTVPIFLLVALSLIEFGRAVYFTQVLDTAARDGVRYAIVNGFQSRCPSGPLPPKGAEPNLCDADGDNVIATVRDRSIGLVDAEGPGYVVAVKWCDSSALEAGTSLCGDQLPCVEWAGAGDAFPLGDGDNGWGQLAAVCLSYSYDSIFSVFIPLPDFTVNARSQLVVNH
jgi:hypothetical protein